MRDARTAALLFSALCIVVGSLLILIVAWERRETRRDREWRQ